jgi:CCR4-NOT complex subunit CAF16
MSLQGPEQGQAMGGPQQECTANVPAALEACGLSYQYGGGATFATRALSEPKLIDVNCSFPRGARVLVAGANGAGKSTLLSIMGGKKMVPRDQCRILGKAVFHDSSLNRQRMYCGDWWRTDFFFNINVAELIGEKMLATERVQKLIDIMQINTSWRINAISDGQRRRCQLLECLAEEKDVYILDEITTDLDLYAREGLLRFLREETEQKGATVFYATHIFDHLAEWATHVLFFSQARIARCCRMEELQEYHALLANGTRCPLYSLMCDWVFREYDAPGTLDALSDAEPVQPPQGPALQTNNLTYSYVPGGRPQLDSVSFSFPHGSRILVVGANGAGKSTLLSILGGKRMIPRGFATVLGKDAFNDPAVSREVMYCGDWWRTNFFMNLTVAELLGDVCNTARCQHLVDVLQVNLAWKINEISDGQRRRCQLLELLATPRPLYLMDEITSDLDLFAREGVLRFMRTECEVRGATIFYCTHIFDHLEGWASHLLHMSDAKVVRYCKMDEVEEYAQLIAQGDSTPLYSLVRRWIYDEYGASAQMPWRKLNDSLDGRIPNLGLAGPFQTVCGA